MDGDVENITITLIEDIAESTETKFPQEDIKKVDESDPRLLTPH
jgi:hypothetical protein